MKRKKRMEEQKERKKTYKEGKEKQGKSKKTRQEEGTDEKEKNKRTISTSAIIQHPWHIKPAFIRREIEPEFVISWCHLCIVFRKGLV